MAITAQDIMVRDVYTVTPQMSVVDMDREFLERHISGAPVMENGKVIGVVSRSDISRELSNQMGVATVAAACAWDAGVRLMDILVSESRVTQNAAERIRQLCVRDIMTEGVVAVGPDADAQTIARIMVEKQIHRVVVAVDGNLHGLVSSLDMIKLLAA